MKVGQRIRAFLTSRLYGDEKAGASVEFVIWVPLLMSIGVMVADTSSAFMSQTQLWHAAGDVARELATGRRTIAQARTRIGTTATLNVTFDVVNRLVTVQLTRPYSQIGTGLFLRPLGSQSVQLRHSVEPSVTTIN